MRKSKHFYIRRAHRYLGIVLGIQFLFWTISGLYFSWTNIDEIHGDFQHKTTPRLAGSFILVSPSDILSRSGLPVDSINSVQVVNILQKPFYSISFNSGGKQNTILADAQTGSIRGDILKPEAIKIAAASFNGEPRLKNVEYITNTNGHHEYREKPLPAWAVTFEHPTNTTIYISARIGKVESFRNNKWRLFDFLWMTHTMDYKERDNINNWLLRIFSAFGLVTVLSGFLLYFVSSKRFKRKARE
jgi:hypothetical protein